MLVGQVVGLERCMALSLGTTRFRRPVVITTAGAPLVNAKREEGHDSQKILRVLQMSTTTVRQMTQLLPMRMQSKQKTITSRDAVLTFPIKFLLCSLLLASLGTVFSFDVCFLGNIGLLHSVLFGGKQEQLRRECSIYNKESQYMGKFGPVLSMRLMRSRATRQQLHN